MKAVEPPTFDEWVRHSFERDPFDSSPPFEAFGAYASPPSIQKCGERLDPAAPIIAQYLAQLFEAPAFLIDRYDGAALRRGFWNICGIGTGYFVTALQLHVPIPAQIRWVAAMSTLYRELFAKACSPHLGHLNEGPCHPLNSAVYMLWDMDTLTHVAARPAENNADHLVAPVFEVLRGALALDSIACQESALHGLGHLARYHRERVGEIIDEFLARSKSLRPELMEYADCARRGYVL